MEAWTSTKTVKALDLLVVVVVVVVVVVDKDHEHIDVTHELGLCCSYFQI